jgi:outer membrane protein assembly factor BamB
MESRVRGVFLALVLLTLAAPVAADWTHWRGPMRTGTSVETGLIDSWTVDGENQLWRVEFTGRSTPVVLADKVCVNGRGGEGVDRQEVATCFDVATGEKLWERRFNVYHTTVPWTRAGWPNPTIDAETGYFYFQGVGGRFFCLDTEDGSTVWERNFMEEFGFMEGYGGRTQTPLVQDDTLYITFSSTGWGETMPPRHRFWAFDKRTGELIWTSTPGGQLRDKNTQSTPAIATVNGTRLLIAGSGDGQIYAVKAGTGEKVWGFHLSQRGINTSAVLDGNRVYFGHSEENVDGGPMGRLVAIDITGTGDVTKTHEVWRLNLGIGFSTPALADGKLYVLDNSANLHVVDAATGEHLSEVNIGRVGKASPVVADGKVYVTEVNGRLVIVDITGEVPEVLHTAKIRTGRRWAETYGSVAISDGRIFFTNEGSLFAIGVPNQDALEGPEYSPAPGNAEGDRVGLLVRPAEVILRPGDEARFTAHAYNANGESLGEIGADWSLEGVTGAIADGVFRHEASKGSQVGKIWADRGRETGFARVRIVPEIPFSEDFEGLEVDARLSYQNGYVLPFKVVEVDGGKALAKNPSPRMIHRHISFLGAPDESAYTIQGDLMRVSGEGTAPDIGLINSGYTLELMGEHQSLEVRSWHSARRMYTSAPFPWEPGIWYRMKLEVKADDETAEIRGKVWPRDEDEPSEWSIVAEDPHPIPAGAPGLSGYSPTPILFDNIEVTQNP